MRHKLIIGCRYVIQMMSLIFFVYLVQSLIYPARWQADMLKWLSRLDPMGLFNYLRFQHAIPAWAWLPTLVLILTLLFGRVFCGWFCPFGALLMITDKLTGIIAKNKRLRKVAASRYKAMKMLRHLRYYWLLILAVALIVGVNWAYTLSPFALFSREISDILKKSAPLALIIILIMTILFSRLWCSVFCPTGLLLSLLGRFRIFRYQVSETCTHCSKCSRSCPVGEELHSEGTTGDGCLTCGECLKACPVNAICFMPSIRRKRSKNENEGSEERMMFTRRQFMKLSGVGLLAAASAISSKHVKAAKKVLRPPGALTENNFEAVCNRCGRCIKICPNHALQPMPLSAGLECYGTPHIIPREASCCLCFSCQEVCPTGAVRKVELEEVHIGKAILDKESCLAWAKNKLCLICVEQCPMGAITYDEKQRPVVQTDRCIGCGSCERSCAVKGEAAIRVKP